MEEMTSSSQETMDLDMKTEKTVRDLNYDVIRHICGDLDTQDLCNSNEISKLWMDATRDEFEMRERRHRRFVITIKEDQSMENWAVVHYFGDLIESLGIYSAFSQEFPHQLRKSLAENCADTLIELAVCNIVFNNEIVNDLETMMLRLPVLNLRDCSWYGKSEIKMFSTLNELHTLSISTERHYLPCNSRVKFPNLKSLTIYKCYNIKNTPIRSFLRRNPQLKELEITESENINSNIIFSICKYNAGIEKIALCNRDDPKRFIRNAKNLKNLKSLKTLQIDCEDWNGNFVNISPIIRSIAAARIPIEHLELKSFKTNQMLIDSISELISLKTLKLGRGDSLKLCDVYKIIRNLNHLTHLDLSTNEITESELKEVKLCTLIEIKINKSAAEL